MSSDSASRRRPRPPHRPRDAGGPETPLPLWPDSDPAPTAAGDPPPDTPALDVSGRLSEARDGQPLTWPETTAMIQAWLDAARGTWRGRAALGLTMLAVASLAWLVISLVLPWSGGIVPTVRGLLALELPWAPVPAPDGSVATRDTGLATAALIAAPLLIAVFWLAAAYHLDHAARRVFGASQVPGVRHSFGYTLMAVAVVFPLIILGLVAGAWGIFALITWASALSAWESALGLVALLGAFAGLVRLANALLDRRAAGV